MNKANSMARFGGGGALNSLKISGIATKKSYAFTLAEVLIALAIIGVVAAMTIPTFMANTAGAQFRTGLKKGITVLTQAASANYATEGYDFSGTNGFYGAGGTAPTALYSTAGGATDDNAIIGFNTASISGEDTYKDLHGDTPSLFHLFQNNLNMKNSKELTNYAVMPADAMLKCKGVTTGKAKIPGGNAAGENVTAPADLTKRPVLAGLAEGAEASTSQNVQASGGLFDLCDGRALSAGGINQGRMFQLEDGMVFTYDPAQAYCSESNPCYGYLDVNGPAGPNRVVACSQPVEGATNENFWVPTYGRNANSGNLLVDCTVESKDITDIFPVLFYGSAVKPASVAAKSVLYSKKSNQITGE